MIPPAEPDLSGFWKKNVWLYGLRLPFSFIFLSWITFAQAISPVFSIQRYLLLLLASFFGLILGSHYIDIASSREKFSPYFNIPSKRMMITGILGVFAGVLIGIYMSLAWKLPLLLIFVVVEGFAAIAYPRERPKFAHSYPSFGMSWGFIPALSSFYAQSGMITILSIGISSFIAVMVVIMHHLAIMTRDSNDWKNALFLFNLYKYGVYLLGVFSLMSVLFR